MNPHDQHGCTLLERVLAHAERNPGRIAYTMRGSDPVTYGTLVARMMAVAARLKRDLPPASTVILSSANRVEYPAAFLGILVAGHNVFAVSSQSADSELLRAAQGSRAVAAIGDARTVDLFRSSLSLAMALDHLPSSSLIDRPRHACGDLMLQSSGTTGLPKIVRRPARAIDAVARACVNAIGFSDRDRVLMTVPLTHAYGLEHGLLAPLWAGSSVHLCDGLNLSVVIPELRDGGITLLPGVPSMFEMLAGAPADPAVAMPSLRAAYSAGAPLPHAVFDAFLRRFGVPVTQLYGLTEVASVTFNSAADGPNPASVGKPMEGVSIRILDASSHAILPPHSEGQVAIRADSMFSGYVDGTAELIDGYFPTGDLGHLDEHGRLFVTGRLKLLIDVGGLKVNPLEVEAVLAEHPGVAACVVIPVQQSDTVFRLKAVVTPKDPTHPPTVIDLRRLAKHRLAAYKVPRLIEIRATLPRSPTGKVLRHLVEAL